MRSEKLASAYEEFSSSVHVGGGFQRQQGGMIDGATDEDTSAHCAK